MDDRRSRAPAGLGGLLQWSIANSGGTDGAAQAPPSLPRAEDRAWFQEAMANQLDIGKRMKEIKLCLDEAGGAETAPTLEQKENLLDELLEIVEDIDHARDLRPIGGLPTLLHLLSSDEASLRARAAAIIGAAAQNNEPVQQWLLDGGALPPVIGQLTDSNSTARIAAFTAVSCMVRHFTTGRQALLQVGGLSEVISGLSNGAPRVQRKAAQLCGALLTDDPDLAPDIAAACAQALPTLFGSGDRQGREAALVLAGKLARDRRGLLALLQVRDLQPSLQRLRLAIEDSCSEEKVAATDEEQLAGELDAALSAPHSGSSKPAAGRSKHETACELSSSTIREKPVPHPAKEKSVPLLLGP